MKITGKIIATLAIMVIAFLTVSCAQVTEEEKTTAREITINLLEGIRQNNYDQFSRDFNADMNQAMDHEAFSELRTMLIEKIGEDRHLELTKTQKTSSQGMDLVISSYKINYTLSADPVDFTIYTYDDNDKTLIAGFSFEADALE